MVLSYPSYARDPKIGKIIHFKLWGKNCKSTIVCYYIEGFKKGKPIKRYVATMPECEGDKNENY